jgi:tetratricopeptide (TPR) repeat protein
LNDNDKKLLRVIAILNNQNFSKNLLKIIFDNNSSVGEWLYNLTRFGLVRNTENIDNLSLFEMHDAIKEGVLELLTEGQKIEVMTNVIKKLNSLMPEGETSRYAFITSDVTIKSNLEVLLENADKYKADIFDVLELRKNLIENYMLSLDYYNVEKMKKWLEEKETDKSLVSNKMNDQQRINYSWYLADIGIYEHFAKAKFVSALSYFGKAKDIIKNIKNLPELKSRIFLETAQAQVYRGDVVNAEKELLEFEKLMKSVEKTASNEFYMGTYWYVKARIFLSKGQYDNSLVAIDNVIKLSSSLSQEQSIPDPTATMPAYIVRSEILNYMVDFSRSYEIIKAIAEQSISNNKPEHEIHARILVQLSRAELGLGLIDNALKHAVIARDIFQKEITKYNITSITNPELAAALVAKADALFKKNQLDEALEAYNEAEIIYSRIYGDNYRYMDDISYLLSQGSKAGCVSKNHFWKKHFYDQMIANFGTEHPRVIEAIAVCSKFE